MALPAAVVGAVRPVLIITWSQADGEAMSLAGATITGRIRNLATLEARDITGRLTVADSARGMFTWEYSPEDVAEAGEYEVQFTAAFLEPPTPARTFRQPWTVEASI